METRHAGNVTGKEQAENSTRCGMKLDGDRRTAEAMAWVAELGTEEEEERRCDEQATECADKCKGGGRELEHGEERIGVRTQLAMRRTVT